jgi:hypothetical protein
MRRHDLLGRRGVIEREELEIERLVAVRGWRAGPLVYRNAVE